MTTHRPAAAGAGAASRSVPPGPTTRLPGGQPGAPAAGRSADFVLLSRDIPRCDPDDMTGTVSGTVVVGGGVVHTA
ncbi:hypothetical protein ACF1G0_26950 [Streptomyces sp. NPDC013953]|uniref:hypothetical protein n=1 Tax=Streptomyces sp. NPDC013953 TaxID=3364868 RepID=UPI0036FB3854